jgi:hypothetical protein
MELLMRFQNKQVGKDAGGKNLSDMIMTKIAAGDFEDGSELD